ncbi:hypothetical protein CJZ73_21085 [Salmonella enterica subsp. enterica serovar Enteritidis]|nr:hypothetical protein CJZ73_21085 [Salmonella enterica subsp. enterica serovar Enteritidis]
MAKLRAYPIRAILLAILDLGSAQNPHVLRVRSGFCALSVSKLAAPRYIPALSRVNLLHTFKWRYTSCRLYLLLHVIARLTQIRPSQSILASR